MMYFSLCWSIIKCTFTWRPQYLFLPILAPVGRIFLKHHASHLPCTWYTQYQFGCNWWKIRGTLPAEHSTSETVPWLPLQVIYLKHDTSPFPHMHYNVYLVSMGQKEGQFTRRTRSLFDSILPSTAAMFAILCTSYCSRMHYTSCKFGCDLHCRDCSINCWPIPMSLKMCIRCDSRKLDMIFMSIPQLVAEIHVVT
jgi:hypothetical protein